MAFGLSGGYDEAKIANYQGDVMMTGGLRRSASEICMQKCIPNYYSEGDLNKGESLCVDRCVVKFLSSVGVLSEEFQRRAQEMQRA
ncbi:uncharacterized protein V1516DRAFT_674456 [Lipomyces oligophaga]|uniref:uncharacterized protein n=1 Tax=Lipomyces oligophaga TaxID=45792 RepID=UPI0034CF62C7